MRKDSFSGFRLSTRKESSIKHFDFIENGLQLFRKNQSPEYVLGNLCSTVKWVSRAFDDITANVLGSPKERFLEGHGLCAHLAQSWLNVIGDIPMIRVLESGETAEGGSVESGFQSVTRGSWPV